MPHSVKVIIPVYTTRLNRFEALTLQNNYQKLQNHPIVLVAPEGLDPSNLLNLYPRCQVETFSPDYFNSISSYNRLMMSEEFYRRFSDVDYILICQTDAYIFRDELAEWCEKGYDYVGPRGWYARFTNFHSLYSPPGSNVPIVHGSTAPIPKSPTSR